MTRHRFFLLTLAVLVWPLAVAAQSYIEPSATPPGGSVAPPLNATDSVQMKAGSLVIGPPPPGIAQALCLNPDVANPSFLPANNSDCINSWAGLVAPGPNPIGGPFVPLHQNPLAANSLLLSSYTVDAGYARIRAASTSHAFSTVAYATPVCNNPTHAAGAGTCLNDRTLPIQTCTVNSDCLSIFGSSPSTAVYGSDGGNANNFAAYFAGRFSIERTGVTPNELCLNGNNAASCIDSWDEVVSAATVNYVKLQSLPPPEAQAGGAGITGVGEVGAVVAGDACAINNPATCGDGFCAGLNAAGVNTCAPVAGPESVASCPIDCTEPEPLASFDATVPSSILRQVRLNMVTGPEPSGANVYYLIVRSRDTAPTFVPQTGVKYYDGEVFGNSTIVAQGTATRNTNISAFLPVETLSEARLYYYEAYQGNIFPRYSFAVQPKRRLLDMVQIGFFKFGERAAVTATALGWTCGGACASLTAFYERNTNISIVLSGDPSLTWTWGGDCSGNGPQCDLMLNANKSVSLNTRYGGPPPPPM